MTHEMKLQPKYFDYILNGTKNIPEAKIIRERLIRKIESRV